MRRRGGPRHLGSDLLVTPGVFSQVRERLTPDLCEDLEGGAFRPFLPRGPLVKYLPIDIRACESKSLLLVKGCIRARARTPNCRIA